MKQFVLIMLVVSAMFLSGCEIVRKSVEAGTVYTIGPEDYPEPDQNINDTLQETNSVLNEETD